MQEILEKATGTQTIAVPQDGRAAVSKPMSFDEMAEAEGATAMAPKSKAKDKTPEVKSTDKITKLIDQYIDANSKRDSAEGQMKVLGGQIRPEAEKLRVAESRAAKAHIKTICLDGKLSYGDPRINTCPANNGPKEALKAGEHPTKWFKDELRALFGEEAYAKYFGESTSLVLKPSVPGDPILSARLFRLLKGDPVVLLPEDKTNNLSLLFDRDPAVFVKRNKDSCPLESDRTTDLKIEVLVSLAVQKGLLSVSNGALTGKKAATNAAVQNAMQNAAKQVSQTPLATISINAGK